MTPRPNVRDWVINGTDGPESDFRFALKADPQQTLRHVRSCQVRTSLDIFGDEEAR
jgi:hypothetical protein